MKKLLLSIGLAFAGITGFSQSAVITPQVATVTNYPSAIFTGADAQVIGTQLLSITNSAGQIVAPASLTNRASFVVILRITNGTNGVPQTIATTIR